MGPDLDGQVADGTMRKDDHAVAGFFEDLAVMVFILAGVSLLISSYASSSLVAQAQAEQERLDYLAEDFVTRVVSLAMEAGEGPAGPSVSVLRGLDLPTVAQRSLAGRCVAASISVLHPYPQVVISFSSEEPYDPLVTGYSEELMNAVDEAGMVVIVEVRCVVW